MIDQEIRIQSVEQFKLLDLEGDEEFQELLQMAADVCGTPVASLTLIDKDTLWLKVRRGTETQQIPRSISFCDHTIKQEMVLTVTDAAKDERFTNSELIKAFPNIKFYAGAPLVTTGGERIGSLCVVDEYPHEFSEQQEVILKMLSKQAINLMELKISVEMLKNSKLAFDVQKQAIRKAEIVQRSFFESSPNFHVLLDSNANIIDFNKTAFAFIKKMHQHSLSRGESLIPFLAIDFVEKFKAGFQQALLGNHVFEEGSTDYGSHGLIYWEAFFETARDSDEQVVGVSYIIRDISERKVNELRVIAQKSSLMHIAHLQSHEFRGPLATIMGMMELIKGEDFNAPREYYELLETAVTNFDEKIHEIISHVYNSYDDI